MNSKRHFDKPFPLYRISRECIDGKTLAPHPMSKRVSMDGEDWRVPRICVSTSVDGAVSSLVDSISCFTGLKFWVHEVDDVESLFKANKVHRPSTRQVPDAEVTGEHWLKAPARFKAIGQIVILGLDDIPLGDFLWFGMNETVAKFKWKWLSKVNTNTTKETKT